MKKKIFTLIMALTMASVLTGCGSDNYTRESAYAGKSYSDTNSYDYAADMAAGAYDGGDYYDDYDYDYSEMADESTAESSGMGEREEKGEESAGDSAANDAAALKRIMTEKLVYNYNVSFYVLDEKIDDVVADVDEAVKRFEGFVEFSNQSDDYYSATIRIPTLSRDSFVEAISEGRDPKGYKLDKSVSNLSSAYTNYQNSYEIAKSNYEAYSSVLNMAQSIDDILTITRYVNEAKGDMDYYTRLMNDIDTDVSYSTISLSISVRETAFIPEPEDLTFGQKLANSFERGLNDFIAAMQGIAIWFVGSIFGLLVFAVIVVIIIFIIRAIIKKSRAKEAERMERVEAYAKSRMDRERMIIESTKLPADAGNANAGNANTGNANTGNANTADANSDKKSDKNSEKNNGGEKGKKGKDGK